MIGPNAVTFIAMAIIIGLAYGIHYLIQKDNIRKNNRDV